ncbi:maf domain-containing protein [Cryptosporidium ubiquitum]|uniref:Maf domain-containing protein n=1 Tax=Cryptosporidium ubiquitum TaxID=857276 RepID=A0A1J4MD65_9CRYT|nr:maf domain-containing protein [Cryptosporidium ubiquitum]OII71427.1 maf domain-containing protein [Cryptosporidium ubiquitum]
MYENCNFQKDYKIVFGTTSESRKMVFSKANIKLSEFVSADIDERRIIDNDPNKLVMKLSEAKMDAVLEKLPYKNGVDKVIVICADSIALKDGEVRNKPRNDEERLRYLRSYSGSYVDCITGVTVYNYYTGRKLTNVTTSRVHYKKMPEEAVQKIFEKSEIIRYSCGGFAIDCPFMGKFVDEIQGDVDNIMGISVCNTVELMEKSIALGTVH